jgi:hypothetical protein
MNTPISERWTRCNDRPARRRPRRGDLMICAFLAVLAGACTSIVAQNEPGALRTAESRAKFELNCPNVTATVLSQKVIQGWRFEGSEHTIGVRGCGRQQVYETFCSDANDCNAVSQTGRVNTLSNLVP